MKNAFWKTVYVLLFPVTIVYLFYAVTTAGEQTLLGLVIRGGGFIVIAYLDYVAAKKTGLSVIGTLSNLFDRLGSPFRKHKEAFTRIAIALGIIGILGWVLLLGALIYYDHKPLPSEQSSNKEKFEQPKILRLNAYSIQLPQSWSVEQLSDQEFRVFRNKTEVGLAKCPMPEKGFEAWSFDISDRIIRSGGKEYGVDYWRGSAVSEDNQDIYLIFMHRGSFNEWYEDGDSSCYLQFNDLVSDLEISGVYQNIKVD